MDDTENTYATPPVGGREPSVVLAVLTIVAFLAIVGVASLVTAWGKL